MINDRRRSISDTAISDPIISEHNDTKIPVLQAEIVSNDNDNCTYKYSNNKRRLKQALWIQTWVLLSLAVAHRQISTCLAAVPSSSNRVSTGSSSIVVDQTDHDIIFEEHESSWDEVGNDDDDDDEQDAVLVIATIDGTLAGLSRRTGKVLWKQQENKQLSLPLLSTTTTTRSSGQDGKTVAVPSVDGRVFLTAKAELTATTTVRELVHRAPFVDSRGRFYVGSRRATAAALDRDSGELLKLVSGDAEEPEHSSLLGRNVVWVGRVDYSVSVYDAQTGAMDVEFSSSEIMSVNDMLSSDKDETMKLTPTLDGLQQHATRLLLPHEDHVTSKVSTLLATPNGNVAYRNADSGQIEWVSDVSFETPVAFAVESSTGKSLRVHILPDAAVPSTSNDYLSKELERQIEAMNGIESCDQTIVGALKSGQLFAMPLGKLSKPSPSGIGLPQFHSSTSSISAIGSTKIKVPNIGRQLQDPTWSHKQKQKHTLSTNTIKRKCAPFSPDFPSCLMGIHRDGDFVGGSFLDNIQDYGALVLQQKLGLDHEEVMQQVKHQYRKKKKSFLRIMASWLPPTMALIFVLSFELGRRQRLKAKDDDPSMVSSVLPVEENGIRTIGVIAVTDEVLGFGGHGTVVYKGMLDGRRVAVKRMLKAYHASADREISLLIESDGHPNVVRYFLKEVRGDFVYLALELCDMSLHDLIGTLRGRATLGNGIPVATKSILLQIAQGVQHLHSLRIVHRDLKPANILLAKRRQDKKASTTTEASDSVLDSFFHGLLIAKISDMGLGKQFTGQSSFGMSTLGGASLSGALKGVDESSHMVGAGPGSVGWQAPEVMSLRWTADAGSVTSDNSSKVKQDALVEASPLDVAMNSRTSRSVDIFSLGCIFHCTLIPGAHPFGEWFEREANIMRNCPSTAPLRQSSPDAFDLVTSMIHRDPKCRPSAKQICEHPFFWSSQRRLAFLCDVSDRIECDAQVLQDGQNIELPTFGRQTLAIERNAAAVVSMAWDVRLDPDLINNVSKFRTYDPSSVRDCLRLIRNKHHHYDELPSNVKARVGSNPDGLLTYFESRFPQLIMHCYMVCRDFMPVDDPLVTKYSIPLYVRRVFQNAESHSSIQQSEQGIESSFLKTNTNGAAEAIDSIAELLDAKPLNVGEEETEMGEASDDCLSYDGMDTIVGIESQDDAPREPNGHDTVVHRQPLEVPVNDFTTEQVASIVLWEGSTATKALNCRGWMRSEDEWTRRTDASLRKRDVNIKRCSEDPKFRSRLCNHWDVSFGTFCPMRKKNKCVFAHGPIELRVKDGKRHRWGTLVDKEGNNSNPMASGGEDTYGAARSVESMRKEEGKWNTDRPTPSRQRPKGKPTPGKKRIVGISKDS